MSGLNALNAILSARVAVVGDVMLDIYVEGEVERISPEAPVPVVRLVSERAVPGGAANVAANVAALGARALLVAVAGDDDGFRQLDAALAAQGGVDRSGIVCRPDRPTTTKLRVVGHRQQITRIDRESRAPLDPETEAEVVRRARIAVAECDALIVSDYGKGLLTEATLRAILDAARERGIPAVVDPKRRDLSIYRGATLLTPNRAELTLSTGLPCETDEEVVAAARTAQRQCGADILVTRSERGMTLVPLQGEPVHLATVAREVFDVSGAGDTVVATVAAALAGGIAMVEAMRAANHAAGIVVGRSGTATVTRAALAAALHDPSHGGDVEDGRLMDLEDLVALRQMWRDRGLAVGFTNGCFDLLHPGHVSIIAQAAAACDRLIVALNTDSSVARLKGPSRPVQSEASRARVVGALKGVATVILFDDETPYRIIAALYPEVLVKGADYREDQVVGADIVRAAGGTVLLAHLIEGQSTTRLVARVGGGGAP